MPDSTTFGLDGWFLRNQFLSGNYFPLWDSMESAGRPFLFYPPVSAYLSLLFVWIDNPFYFIKANFAFGVVLGTVLAYLIARADNASPSGALFISTVIASVLTKLISPTRGGKFSFIISISIAQLLVYSLEKFSEKGNFKDAIHSGISLEILALTYTKMTMVAPLVILPYIAKSIYKKRGWSSLIPLVIGGLILSGWLIPFYELKDTSILSTESVIREYTKANYLENDVLQSRKILTNEVVLISIVLVSIGLGFFGKKWFESGLGSLLFLIYWGITSSGESLSAFSTIFGGYFRTPLLLLVWLVLVGSPLIEALSKKLGEKITLILILIMATQIMLYQVPTTYETFETINPVYETLSTMNTSRILTLTYHTKNSGMQFDETTGTLQHNHPMIFGSNWHAKNKNLFESFEVNHETLEKLSVSHIILPATQEYLENSLGLGKIVFAKNGWAVIDTGIRETGVTRVRPGLMIATAKENGVNTVSESYFPGWYVNGKPAFDEEGLLGFEANAGDIVTLEYKGTPLFNALFPLSIWTVMVCGMWLFANRNTNLN